MEISVSVHDWLQLPMETRVKLCEIFQIPKSQGTWVENSIVRSDGHTHQDLQAGITVEKMQAFTESTATDFLQLFHATLDKVDAELKALQPAPPNKLDPSDLILQEWAIHLGRMQYQANNLGMTDHFRLLISKFLPNAPINTTQVPAAKGQSEGQQKRPPSRSVKAKKSR